MANPKTVTIDNQEFSLEIAQNQQEREVGLMDRKILPPNQGMLFLFDQKEIQSFWMKNTLIPLQIIFVDGCKIVDIQEMAVEKDPANPKIHYLSKFPVDKVIELNSESVPINIVGQEIQELCK